MFRRTIFRPRKSLKANRTVGPISYILGIWIISIALLIALLGCSSHRKINASCRGNNDSIAITKSAEYFVSTDSALSNLFLSFDTIEVMAVGIPQINLCDSSPAAIISNYALQPRLIYLRGINTSIQSSKSAYKNAIKHYNSIDSVKASSSVQVKNSEVSSTKRSFSIIDVAILLIFILLGFWLSKYADSFKKS